MMMLIKKENGSVNKAVQFEKEATIAQSMLFLAMEQT